MIEEVSVKDCGISSLRDFDCGEETLNLYLSNYAKQNDERGLGRTFVLMDGAEVIGFYTLSSAQIKFGHLPSSLSKRLPRYPIPAIRLARLAVSKNHQGKGMGSLLLKHAFKRVLLASLNTGVAFVLVDAKDNAKGFYEHFGFTRLSSEGDDYALPISSILKAVIQ